MKEQEYEAPGIIIYEIQVEQGFATSIEPIGYRNDDQAW